jgi:hypothetical protein
MTKIPFNLRIFVALFLSFLLVQLSLKAPHIDSISVPAVIQPVVIFNIPTVIPTEKIIPTPILFPTIRPTISLIIPTQKVIPTVFSIIPTLKIIPTLIPTSLLIPTTKPTARSLPTVIKNKTVDYSTLNAFVANMPQIGCKNNTTIGCPVTSLYNTPLNQGLGYATYYGNDIVAEVIGNRKGISLSEVKRFISETSMEKQSDMTPVQARATGKVIGYGATRSPADLWRIKYLFAVDNPKNPQARFIGRIIIMDCPHPNDWSNRLATSTYSYKGWTRLNWIVDLSKNGFIQLPTGLSGRQENIGEGRPGVILVDEANLDSLIY